MLAYGLVTYRISTLVQPIERKLRKPTSLLTQQMKGGHILPQKNLEKENSVLT